LTVSTALRDMMRADETAAILLVELERLGPPARPVTIPTEAQVVELLTLLNAPVEDIPDVVEARPLIADDPEVVWLLERHVNFLDHYTGVVGGVPRFVEIPPQIGPLSRFFYLYVYMCAFPNVRKYHASLGIPDDVSLEILSDLGRNMRVNQKRTGSSGLAAPWWCMLHFRGVIYQFGRIQFERAILGEAMAESINAAGFQANPTDQTLSLHIPDFMGPFPPVAIDASIARAKEFFAKYIPEQPTEFGVCYSWLLDDQMPDHLSADSNIIRFHNRFHLINQWDRNDSGAALFLWGLSTIPAKPREGASTLERAIIAHHASGGHWGGGSGWTRL
jgi:hypothetical protein